MGSGISTDRKKAVSEGTDLKEQDKGNRIIEKNLKEQERVEKSSRKLLLLGPGESGKSTILKQMRIIHNKGFTTEEVHDQKCNIRRNVIQAMASLLQAMETLGIHHCLDRIKDTEPIFATAKAIQERNLDSPADLELSEAVKRLWNDNSVQACYERRTEYQLIDSAKYFFDNVSRIFAQDYRPTQDDILHCRVRTTAVAEVMFEAKGLNFWVIDVGGQRSERRKWINCFDNVHSIIFIASLSEYNQTLEEDNETNRMRESLALFHWVCHQRIFRKTPIILFLNKQDLFTEKIQYVPLTVVFPEYSGTQDPDECISFIKKQYRAQNPSRRRRIYAHQTCATDTKQVAFVIKSTIDSILEQLLTTTAVT